MNFAQVINKRKSIRMYTSRPVSKQKIRKILELVNLAPSAGNLQAFKIFVIKDKEKMSLINANIGGVQRNLANLVPVILVFCANTNESAKKYAEKGMELYSIQDATIACAYAQLAATSLNLGSCWVGSFDAKQIQKLLKTDLFPVSMLLIGYGLETPPRRPRKPLSQLVAVV